MRKKHSASMAKLDGEYRNRDLNMKNQNKYAKYVNPDLEED